MSLPAVAPGENPYTASLLVSPTRFQISVNSAVHVLYLVSRASSLQVYALTVACSGMVVSVIYGLILVPQYRRGRKLWSDKPSRHGDDDKPRFWVVRKVDGYVTMNSHFLIPCGGFISCACMLVWTSTLYIVFWENRLLGPVYAFRSFMWPPVVMHGYFVTCASVQAWVVVASKTARMGLSTYQLSPRPTSSRIKRLCSFGRLAKIPGPRAFNALFYSLTALMLVAMFGTDIAFTVSWTSLWRSISRLQDMLVSYEKQWDGSFNASAMLNLQQAYGQVSHKMKANKPYANSVAMTLSLVAIIVTFLNIGSFALLFLLRKQIRNSLRRRSRSRNIFPMQPADLRALREKSPVLASPAINITFPSRPRPSANRVGELNDVIGLAPCTTDEFEKRSAGHSPSDVDEVGNTDATPHARNSPDEKRRPALPTRLSSVGRALVQLPTLPRMPTRKTSSLTVRTAWTAGSSTLSATPGLVTPPEAAKTTGSHRTAKLDTPSPHAMIYAPASPAMAIDLGGDNSLSDLRRAERDLIICVLVVVTMGIMFTGENMWNYFYVKTHKVTWKQNEISWFFIPWVYAITYTTACSFLIVSALFAMHRARRARDVSASNSREIGIDTFVGGGVGDGPAGGSGDRLRHAEAGEAMRINAEVRTAARAGGGTTEMRSLGCAQSTTAFPLAGMGIDGVVYTDELRIQVGQEGDGSTMDERIEERFGISSRVE